MTCWGMKGTHLIRPKHKGSGLILTNFIDEKHGYPALAQEKYNSAKVKDSSFKMKARVLLVSIVSPKRDTGPATSFF